MAVPPRQRGVCTACVFAVALVGLCIVAAPTRAAPLPAAQHPGALSPQAQAAPTTIVAVYRKDGTRANCTLIHLDYLTGAVKTVADVTPVCMDYNPDSGGIPRSTLDLRNPARPAVLFVSGSGKSLHSIDALTGASTVVAALPADRSFTLGVQVVADKVYLITIGQLFRLDGATFTNIASLTGLGLQQYEPVCSMQGSIFVAGSKGLVTLASLDAAKASAHLTPLSGDLTSSLDLQCDVPGSRLLALANYELYSISPASGASSKVIAIPDGDGYPGTSAMSGTTFAFADFQHAFTIQTAGPGAPAIASKVPFDGYFCMGNMHFLPTRMPTGH